METKTISIKLIEQRQSQQGKTYWSIETDQGKMTCFEKDIAEQLQKAQFAGVRAAVSVVEKNGFVNIRKVVDVLTSLPAEVEDKGEKFTEARAAKDTSIYTSYVKDLVISGMKLEDAIKAVKQIREAFK